MLGYGFWRIVNVVLIVGTLIGILQPAFSQNIGLTQILLSLFQPELSQEFLMRWLLVLAFAAFCYIFIVNVIFRNVPITIVSTKIVVDFIKDDFSEVVVHREQLLRANQPYVTAYFSSHSPTSPSGYIKGISARAYRGPDGFKSSIETFGEPDATVEIFHMFEGGLPYQWFMPLIPIPLLGEEYDKIWRPFRSNIVKRTNSIVWADEYIVEKPLMDFAFTTGRYHHKNVEILLKFPKDAIPPDLRVMRIQHNGVTNITPDHQTGGAVSIRSDKIGLETIRITWTNRLARQQLRAGASSTSQKVSEPGVTPQG